MGKHGWRNWHRFLSAALSLIILLGMMPLAAAAAFDFDTDQLQNENNTVTSYAQTPESTDMGEVNLEDLDGVYKGTYTAAQGLTGLTLTIHGGKAVFNFYCLPGYTNVPVGVDWSYYADITVDHTGNVFIRGSEWLMKPPSEILPWYFVDLIGRLDLGGRAIRGRVVPGNGNPFSGDWDFELTKETFLESEIAEYFEDPSNEYNHELAVFAANLSERAYTQNKIRNWLLVNGFNAENIIQKNYDTWNLSKAGYTIANREILKNGAPKNLIIVAVRGEIGWEWADGANIGLEEMRAGFGTAGADLRKDLNILISHIMLQNTHENVILVTGHGRGGAVANLVAKDMNGDSFYAPQDDIYTYTFASPNADKNSLRTENSNIFNIISCNDAVPGFPFDQEDAWGRNGKDLCIGTNDAPGHSMAAYIQWLKANPGLTENDWNDISDSLLQPSKEESPQLVSVKGSVDITVHDSRGNVVASIANGIVKSVENSDVFTFIIDDVRQVFLPRGNAYTVVFTAANSGKMEYSVRTVNHPNAEEADVKGFDNVVLQAGKTMLSQIAGETLQTQLLVTENGEVIAIINEDGTENHNIAVITFDKNGGDTEASPSIYAVQKNSAVDLIQVPPAKMGQIFTGWNTKADGSGSLIDPIVELEEDYFIYIVKDGEATITKYTGFEEALIIPEVLGGYTVKGIAGGAFDECVNLTSISVPGTVVAIEQDAFYWIKDDINNPVNVVTSDEPGSYAENYFIVNGLINNSSETDDYGFISSSENTGGHTYIYPVENGGDMTLVDGLTIDQFGSGSPFSTPTTVQIDPIRQLPKKYTATLNAGVNVVSGCVVSMKDSDNGEVRIPELGEAYIRATMENPFKGTDRKPELYKLSDDGKTIKRVSYEFFGENQTYIAFVVAEPGRYIIVDETVNTVTINTNGGFWTSDFDDTPKTLTNIRGENLTIIENIPLRDGFVFKGWSVSSTAAEAQYQPGDKILIDGDTSLFAVWYKDNNGVPSILQEDIVLYAQWGPVSCTISYDANGGDDAPDNQIKTGGVTLTLSNEKPAKKGHTFLGWVTEAGEYYSPGDAYIKNEDVTLYAVWWADSYEITYDVNGGSDVLDSQIKVYDVPLTLRNARPIKTGYTFIGWSTDENEMVAKYQPGDSFEENTDITLFAVWLENEYTILYDVNGGVGAPDGQTQIKTYGVALTLLNEQPTREGYVFGGWSTSSTASTASWESGGDYTANEDITLYAVWQIKADNATVLGTNDRHEDNSLLNVQDIDKNAVDKTESDTDNADIDGIECQWYDNTEDSDGDGTDDDAIVSENAGASYPASEHTISEHTSTSVAGYVAPVAAGFVVQN